MDNSKHISILYSIIIILLIALFLTHRTVSKKYDNIVIPEKIGKLQDSTPKLIRKDTTYLQEFRDTIIKYYNPVDTVYITKYIKADEIKRAEMYLDAKGKRSYSNSLEDENIIIDYTAETEGTLTDLRFDYKIKEFEYTIEKPEETLYSIYSGLGFNSTTDLTKPKMHASVGVQDNSGNIYYLNYAKDKSIQIGIMFKLFSVKK